MGLFDFTKGDPPSDLRAELFSAVTKGDARKLAQLCGQHEAEILAEFPSWQKAPEHIRTDPEAMQRYANGLIGLAAYFMQERGEPALMARLQGGGGSTSDNPIDKWRDALGQADQHKSNLAFDEGMGLLQRVLSDVSELKGTAVDRLLPVTLGRLGNLQFQSGAVEDATASTKRALELCRAQNDNEGVKAYLGNLYEFHRYGDQPADAARYAAQIAELQGPDAPWFQSQAEILRDGEPLNRIVVRLDDRRMEVDEAPTDGRLAFINHRNRQALFASHVWTQRGMGLGRDARYEEALGAFEEAARADPFDPDPHYQSAITNLYLQRHQAAADAYDRTEDLAPGWFHCRAERWLANEAAEGRLPHDTVLLILQAVDGHGDPPELLRRVRLALEQTPHVPLLDLVAAKLQSALGDRPSAVTHLRQGLDKTPEPDTKTRLLVDLALKLDRSDESTALLREAAALDGNLVAGATARLALRARE